MKSIVFDTGPIISLTLNNLLWLMKPLKEHFAGDFMITDAVYNELIRRPLDTKKYKFEALQILPLIADGLLNVQKTEEIHSKAMHLQELANSCFFAHGNNIKIVHIGEMEALACAIINSSSAIFIDERTTRTLIESPELLKDVLSKKLHTDINVDQDKLEQLKAEIGHLPVLRSFELVTIAFELGLLERYMPANEEKYVANIRDAVLEGVLWGVKLNGCSVKREDIDSIMQMEKTS